MKIPKKDALCIFVYRATKIQKQQIKCECRSKEEEKKNLKKWRGEKRMSEEK